MKLKIYDNECWIKEDVILQSNLNQMNEKEKLNYIYKNKLIHREDGPAVINSNGFKSWWLNGLRHRIDGPAIIFYNGTKEWYLNDKCVDGEKYKKIENSSKEELLMYMILPKYKDYISLIEYRLNII